MWKLDFSRRTLAWLLAAAFVLGLGVHIVRRISNGEADYPLTVVESSAETRALRERADSMLAERALAASAPVNINTAGTAELETLDGIGKVLAARIVRYREEHGPFTSVDELENVSGIGPKRMAAIRERCIVGSP